MTDNKETKQAPAVEAARDERAAFEAYARTVVEDSPLYGLSLEWAAYAAEFVEQDVQDAWEIWQARAALARASEAQPTAWKTTHPAVCVPITEDRAVAEQWRTHGWPVYELFSRASEAAAAPAGWKTVPVKPTQQQLAAICESYWGDGWDDEDFREARIVDARNMYRAMLAAPKPACRASEAAGEPIYQAEESAGIWRDVPKEEFDVTHHARIVYAAPQPASEQQANRGLSDAVRCRLEFYAAGYCKSTNETDREAGKALYALLAAKGDGHADD